MKGHDFSRAAKPQQTTGLQPLRDTLPTIAKSARSVELLDSLSPLIRKRF